MSSSDISVSDDSFTEENILPDNIYLYILLAILYLPSSRNTYLKQKIQDHEMDVSYQLKPLINNLNNTSTIITRDRSMETKPSVLTKNNVSFIGNTSIISENGLNEPSQMGSPYSFEDILKDDDKERIDMVYENPIVTNPGVINNYSLDLNLTKKDILELIKYFFSVYTLNKEEATELKRKIKNYSTEGLVKDIEYYINLVEKDSGFIKNDNFSSIEKYNLWKSNELNEANQLQKFYSYYLDNKSKMNQGNPKNSKLIHLRILEAKNLKAKNDNNFSNPYFIVEVGGKEFESQVIFKNINPSWDFSTVIFLKETDTVKITLWSRTITDESKLGLVDKSIQMFRSSKDKFLGQVILTYAEIARYFNYKNVLDQWYVLQKRSSKSHVSGELRVSFQFIDEKSLSISHSMFTFIPTKPNICCQYLIETVIKKELQCAKENNTRFMGFSKNAETLFKSCTILWRINKLFVISKILNILLDEYISNNIDAETLYNSVLIDLKENENVISPKENKRSINQSLQRLHSYLSRHLTTFNDHFFNTENGTDLDKTLHLLQFLYRCKFSDCYNEDPNSSYQYSQELIKKGIVARYHSIYASLNPEDPKLLRIIQLIPIIKDEISLYMEKFPRQEKKLSIIHSSVEYFINQINDDISEFKVNPNILKEDLNCSFELIDELVDLRNKCSEVGDGFKYMLNVDDYLIICVQEWLRLTNIKANEWINNSIKLDDFKPQMNDYISSSVIDVFTYCNQIFNFFINISWPDKKNLKNCLIHLVMIINKSLTVYLDGMRSTLIDELIQVRRKNFRKEKIKYINNNRKSFLQRAFSTRKQKIEDKNKEADKRMNSMVFEEESALLVNSSKVCICLNNIYRCKEELEALYERIEKVYEECGGVDETFYVAKNSIKSKISNESNELSLNTKNSNEQISVISSNEVVLRDKSNEEQVIANDSSTVSSLQSPPSISNQQIVLRNKPSNEQNEQVVLDSPSIGQQQLVLRNKTSNEQNEQVVLDSPSIDQQQLVLRNKVSDEQVVASSPSNQLVLKNKTSNDKYYKTKVKIENKYKNVFENKNDDYIIQPVQYINEKIESPFLNDFFITFSVMGTKNTLQNSAHTKPTKKYISTELEDELNTFYLELPKSNCTLDICIWHGNESSGYNIYEKTCIVINRDDFVGQPMKEISIKFSDHSQLLINIKLENDFIDFYNKQINSIIDSLIIELQRIIVRNMGGDICYSIGCILQKFESVHDIVKTRVLNSEKLNSYAEPLVNYLQYNLNIFFDKLCNELDPINNIIYYIWLETLAIIEYYAIAELEYKPKTSNIEHISCYNYLDQTKLHLNTDMEYTISNPGRVFMGKLNERQNKYLTFIIEALKELFNCGDSGIPNEKLEQKEFKEVKSILGHYGCDNRKLKVIYNHNVERSFSLYDNIWILNLLTAKGSNRFIRVKLYEMKVKLEKMMHGVGKKYESSISVHENHKRITSSIMNQKVPTDMPLYDECDNELDSNVSSNYSSTLMSNNGSVLNSTTFNRASLNRNRNSLINNRTSLINNRNENKILSNIKNDENIANNTISQTNTLTSEETYNNSEMKDSHQTLVNSQKNSSILNNNNNNINKVDNSELNDTKINNNNALIKNVNNQKMVPYIINNNQDKKVI